jgi:serine/threonine-protein kinase
MDCEPGQKIGDYEIVAKLGAGGLGVVYEVEHRISHRREAMKILLTGQAAAPGTVERFHREVQTLATLNHPNIASLHNAFYYQDQLIMVMELIPGETLRERQLRGHISVAEAIHYLTQTLHALDYAHHLGVVHRDIKPSNIMIAAGNHVKLLDFGIARTEEATEITRTGFLMGSLNYMSPEQVRGDKATPRSDLYSAGVTLYELLTGQLPITGTGNYQIMMGHMEQIPIAPAMIAPHLPPALSAAVMRALEKLPEARFASAAEFLRALQSIPLSQDATATMAPPALGYLPPMPSIPSARPPQSLRNPATSSASAPAGTLVQRTPSGSGLQSLELEQVSRKLAVYIGPVARVVVKKLAGQYEDLDQIYREAARQISSESDRAAFLRSRNQ